MVLFLMILKSVYGYPLLKQIEDIHCLNPKIKILSINQIIDI